MSRLHHLSKRIRRFWTILGPGLITGAGDDDPSAITTFSQAGARYGTSTLWVAIAAFPVLAVLQENCARIGLVTGKGLASVIRANYPRWVIFVVLGLTCPAFILNIGADIAIVGHTGNLVFSSVPSFYFSVAFALSLFILIVFLPYQRIISIMKFLCLVLLVYVIVPFLVPQDRALIVRESLIPTWHFDKEFLLIIMGLTGAILSPYVFFWQSSSEAVSSLSSPPPVKRRKDPSLLLMRKDILAGAFFAVVIMYFVILAAGTILHQHHVVEITTARDAALALRPLSGTLSYLLFSIGILGTGLIIIPILTSSISLIVTEAFGGKTTRSSRPGVSYAIIALAMLLGLSMHWFGISPVKALLFTTELYGFVTPFLIFMILLVSNNKKIMGDFCNGRVSNFIGIVALILMLANMIGIFLLW